MTPQKNGEGQDLVCVQHQTKRRNCKRVRPAIYSSMTLRNEEREREEKEKEREEDKDNAEKLDDKEEQEGIKECDGEDRNNGSLLSYFLDNGFSVVYFSAIYSIILFLYFESTISVVTLSRYSFNRAAACL